jgi:AraC-like DNA-binding protein
MEKPTHLLLPPGAETVRLKSGLGPVYSRYIIPYAMYELEKYDSEFFFTQSLSGYKSWMELLSFTIRKECQFGIKLDHDFSLLSYLLDGNMEIFFNGVRVCYRKEKYCTAMYAPKGIYTIKVTPGFYSIFTVIPTLREFRFLQDINPAICQLIKEQQNGGLYAKILPPSLIEDGSYAVFDMMRSEKLKNKGKGTIDALVMTACTALVTFFRVEREKLIENPLYQAIDYINDHLLESDLIKINEIAKRFYLTYRTFLYQFEQLIGIRIHDYITYERLKTAHELLSTTDLPVRVIAEKVGYKDVSRFYKDFKKLMFCSPNSLRK